MTLELVKEWKSFGCAVRRYRHTSAALGGLQAVFSVVLPPAALADDAAPVPGVVYLSGLTCTDDNVITKAGAQRACAEHGVALICPDTSPRGANLGPEETAAWDFGAGAGFYVDATRAPWSAHYRMYTYVTEELPAVLAAGGLPVDGRRLGITGHSMGGLGALQIALKRPDVFRSVTAFAPICHPSACPWGVKAFTGYLGPRDEAAASWASYDPTELVARYSSSSSSGAPGSSSSVLHILIDQGGEDGFLKDGQLRPEDFVAAAAGVPGVSVQYRLQPGYDHSYFFIATFIDDHIAHAARALKQL
jgi:S-formylglutathione hydrolase